MSRERDVVARPDAGVADEEVEPAERIRRALDELVRAGARRDVRRVRDGVHAVLASSSATSASASALPAPIADRDVHAVLGEQPRRRGADAARAAA